MGGGEPRRTPGRNALHDGPAARAEGAGSPPVNECANYLPTYKDLLKNDEYLAQGLPIATGVIEGACRHLVKDRMDLAGARWGLQRAEAVLKLRSLASSGDSESYREFYKAQALRRNHASRYASPLLPEAA